jgi:hypothetical protein
MGAGRRLNEKAGHERRPIMEPIETAMRNIFPTESTGEELHAQIASDLDCLKQLLAELEHPQYRELIKFAVLWQRFDQKLAALERSIQKYSAGKPTSPVDQFLKKLRGKD